MLEENREALANVIFAFDAMNTRRPVLAKIRDIKADYFACLKKNERLLYEAVERAFADKKSKFVHGRVAGSMLTDDGTSTNWKIRSDIEILPVSVLPPELREDNPTVKNIVVVRNYKVNETTELMYINESYYVTSLTADNQNQDTDVAEEFLKIKLKRWGIETFHKYCDNNFGQDNMAFRSKDAANARTLLHKVCFNCLRNCKEIT